MKNRIISLILIFVFIASFKVGASANNTKLIAFTFDDGPTNSITPKLLDALAERNVKVTFFLVGRSIELFPDVAKRAFEEGHQLCNHSYSHAWFTSLNSAGIKNEVSKTNALISEIGGADKNFVRIPYGDMNSSVKSAVQAPIIQWSVDPGNGNMNLSEQAMISNLLKNAKDGSIVILHDVNQKNLNVAVTAIDALLKQGYELVTLDELFRLRGIEPKNGTVYYSVPQSSSETKFDESRINEHWASDYIEFVTKNGIMEKGIGSFEPNFYLTRAMAATILWRMADCPAAKTTHLHNHSLLLNLISKNDCLTEFEDVSADSWYFEAVTWSHSNQYIKGVSDNTFSPDTYITKEQFYTLLARYGEDTLCAAPAVDSPAVYRDDVRISPWAKEGVEMFRNSGFESLNDPQIFRPLDYITKAEAAELITWLMRDCPKSGSQKTA